MSRGENALKSAYLQKALAIINSELELLPHKFITFAPHYLINNNKNQHPRNPLTHNIQIKPKIPMNTEFINLTTENLADEHLCCIIRSKKPHPGVEAKRKWLSERLKEGHVFRKLNVRGTVFIEYAPLETAWVPIIGNNYYYIYCLWVLGNCKGNGYARALMEYCIADAKEKGRSGICMLGSKKQKNWLSNQAFARKFGFETVDTTDNGYELLALSFDGTTPEFAPNAKSMQIENQELTIYYDMQCPYIYQTLEAVKQHCETNNIPLSLIHVDTLQKAKELPCVFNNWGAFYKGNFETVNLLLDMAYLDRILKK